MKTIYLMIFLLVLTSVSLAGKPGKYKAIQFKTAVVEYVFEGSTTGKQTIYYGDYGWMQYKSEETVAKAFGQKSVTNMITLTRGFDIWSWDPKTLKGTKSHNVIAEDIMNDPDYDPEDFAREVMEATGIKKVGTEMVEGRLCDVFEGMGTKSWIWKGILVKAQSSMMGIKVTQKAVDIKTDGSVGDSRFEIPGNVSFQEVEGDPVKAMNQAMEEERRSSGESGETKDKNSTEPEVKSFKELKDLLKNLPKE